MSGLEHTGGGGIKEMFVQFVKNWVPAEAGPEYCEALRIAFMTGAAAAVGLHVASHHEKSDEWKNLVAELNSIGFQVEYLAPKGEPKHWAVPVLKRIASEDYRGNMPESVALARYELDQHGEKL